MIWSTLYVIFTAGYEICKFVCVLMVIYTCYLYIKNNRNK